MKMIGCYVTGMLPRPKELIDVTRAYDRGRTSERQLEDAFDVATQKVIDVQSSAGFSYVTDGMLKWQDLLRPFTENIEGIKAGSLARWFNNNTFYRKPRVIGEISRLTNIVEKTTYIKHLPSNLPWKTILPAPYTFVQLSENHYYRDKTELLFEYAKILHEEIKSLAKLGFRYVQLSDPALVYKPTAELTKEQLSIVIEALNLTVKQIPIKICLQTFFGDFSQILPEALDFPVDHFGIDFYETNFEKLKEYKFDKGVALGLVDSRSSLVENEDKLVEIAIEIIRTLHCSLNDVFVCPNCDLEFLPWERAEKKMRVVGGLTKRLKEELNE